MYVYYLLPLVTSSYIATIILNLHVAMCSYFSDSFVIDSFDDDVGRFSFACNLSIFLVSQSNNVKQLKYVFLLNEHYSLALVIIIVVYPGKLIALVPA